MFGFLVTAQRSPAHRVEEIGALIKQVFVRLGFPFKNAAFDMAMQPPHLSRGLNEHGLSVTRLAMLPEDVKREIWLALAPHFGVTDLQKTSPQIEQRLADLEVLVRQLASSTREAAKERSCA
jgi:hypothetical protein